MALPAALLRHTPGGRLLLGNSATGEFYSRFMHRFIQQPRSINQTYQPHNHGCVHLQHR